MFHEFGEKPKRTQRYFLYQSAVVIKERISKRERDEEKKDEADKDDKVAAEEIMIEIHSHPLKILHNKISLLKPFLSLLLDINLVSLLEIRLLVFPIIHAFLCLH